jgi:hypothetical protein
VVAAVLTPAQYKKKYGANWQAQLAKDKAAYAAAQAEYAEFKGPKKFSGFGGETTRKPGSLKYLKKIHAANLKLPHKPKTGIKGFLNKVAPKIIAGAATAGVGAGLAQAASGALSDAGIDLGSVTGQGGFGPGGGGLQVLPESGDGMGLFGSGGTLDDIFGGLSKAGQYAQSAGEALAQFKGAFGSQGGGGGGGGGGPSADYGPVAPSAPAMEQGGMQRYLPWILLGGGALVLVLVMRKGR